MQIELNNHRHLADFIRLNEIWITEHFALEAADKALAENPSNVIANGGFIFSMTDGERVVGVCALFKETSERYQLARMAVALDLRGQGYGRALIEHAIQHAQSLGATSLFLLSNTVLEAAISLYQKSGFTTIWTGQHPVYARCNIIMERSLQAREKT